MPPLCQPGRGGHELDLIKGLGGPSGLWSAVAPLPSRDGSRGAWSSRVVRVVVASMRTKVTSGTSEKNTTFMTAIACRWEEITFTRYSALQYYSRARVQVVPPAGLPISNGATERQHCPDNCTGTATTYPIAYRLTLVRTRAIHLL